MAKMSRHEAAKQGDMEPTAMSKVPDGAPFRIEAIPPDAKWKFSAGHIVHGAWHTVDYSHPTRKPVQYVRADIADAMLDALKDMCASQANDHTAESHLHALRVIAKAEGAQA